MPLVAIAIAAFALLAWKNLRAAFLLFVGLLPVYLIRFTIGGLPTTALEILFVTLFIAWMIRREKRLIDIRGWRLLLLLWIVVATVSLFVSPDFRAAAGVWKAYFIEPIIFFLLANDLLRTDEDREAALKALAATAIVIGASAIVQRFTGWGVPPPFNGAPIPPATDAEFRSTSFYGFPNAVGLFLAPLVPLFVMMASTHPPSRKEFRAVHFYWLASALLAATGVLLARSAGAVIGVLAGLFFMGLMHAHSRRPTAVIAVLGFILLLALPATRTYVTEKLTINDSSGRVRRLMWNETWNMLKDHPVFGAGLSGYPIVFDRYHQARYIEIFQYPHDEALNFWTETGFFGMLLFFATTARVFLVARRTRLADESTHPWTIALAAAFVVILVHGTVDVPYFKNDLAMQFWLLIALLSSIAAQKKMTAR